MKYAFLAFAIVSALSGNVFAQGAPLLLPAKAATPATTARLDELSKRPNVVKITFVTVDPYALNANVITITLGKKTYTFVGQLERTSAEHETWISADAKSGNGVVLTRSAEGVTGSFRIDDAYYYVEPDAIIQQSLPSRPLTVAPAFVIEPLKSPGKKQ